jgi:hypothetical protein
MKLPVSELVGVEIRSATLREEEDEVKFAVKRMKNLPSLRVFIGHAQRFVSRIQRCDRSVSAVGFGSRISARGL